MATSREEIREIIREHPGIGFKGIFDSVSSNRNTVKVLLNRMAKDGWIERKGTPSNFEYYVSEKLLDDRRYRESVSMKISSNPVRALKQACMTHPDLLELLGVDNPTFAYLSDAKNPAIRN